MRAFPTFMRHQFWQSNWRTTFVDVGLNQNTLTGADKAEPKSDASDKSVFHLIGGWIFSVHDVADQNASATLTL